jgi:hypothetical protein
MEIATMCGHGLVSLNLITYLADKVKQGKMTAEKAGEQLAKGCICGVFIAERASEILKEFI